MTIVVKNDASSVAVELITNDGITRVSPFTLFTDIVESHAADIETVT